MFAIEARDLVKVYSGNVVALNGVDLRVEEGHRTLYLALTVLVRQPLSESLLRR
jgi:hypothetical protein